jgi:hypothetical protein
VSEIFQHPGHLSNSGHFHHPSRFDAIRARHYFFDLTVFCGGSDPLQIGVEPTIGDIMGMADMMSGHRFFSANFTNS